MENTSYQHEYHCPVRLLPDDIKMLDDIAGILEITPDKDEIMLWSLVFFHRIWFLSRVGYRIVAVNDIKRARFGIIPENIAGCSAVKNNANYSNAGENHIRFFNYTKIEDLMLEDLLAEKAGATRGDIILRALGSYHITAEHCSKSWRIEEILMHGESLRIPVPGFSMVV